MTKTRCHCEAKFQAKPKQSQTRNNKGDYMNFTKINKKVWMASAIALVVFVSFTFVLIQKSSKGGSGGEIYYCPMHPTYTSDRPGDCPICNMKLVKKESMSSPRKR